MKVKCCMQWQFLLVSSSQQIGQIEPIKWDHSEVNRVFFASVRLIIRPNFHHLLNGNPLPDG